MKKPLFSIIITTFNNSNTIKQTLDSVINQTLDNSKYEIIVVDDNSTDNTLDILKSYNVSNLKIHQLNSNSGGPSKPRNVGIDYSRGKYVHFLDGDDWLDLNVLQNITSKYYNFKSDIIIAKVIKYKDGNQTIHAKFMTTKENLNKKANDIPYLYYYLGPSGKFIKRKLILKKHLKFPYDLHFGEDKLFFMNVFASAKTVTTIPTICNYLNRSSDNTSIVKKADFITKRKSDLFVFQSALNIPNKSCRDKFLLRIVQYDLLNNCNSNVFLRLNDSQQLEVFNIIKKMYENDYIKKYIIPLIDSKYHNAINAIYNNDLDKFVQFFEWYKHGTKILNKLDKKTYVQESTCNYNFEIIVPFANTKNLQFDNQKVYLQVNYHNLNENQINGILLDSRSNFRNSILLNNFSIKQGLLSIQLDYMLLNKLVNGIYNVLIIYDDYKTLNIKYGYTKKIETKSNSLTFYPTINGNISIKCQTFN